MNSPEILPAGYCPWGHQEKYYSFQDKGGTWRCRPCMQRNDLERSYWKLVARLSDGDTTALATLERYHWRYA